MNAEAFDRLDSYAAILNAVGAPAVSHANVLLKEDDEESVLAQ